MLWCMIVPAIKQCKKQDMMQCKCFSHLLHISAQVKILFCILKEQKTKEKIEKEIWFVDGFCRGWTGGGSGNGREGSSREDKGSFHFLNPVAFFPSTPNSTSKSDFFVFTCSLRCTLSKYKVTKKYKSSWEAAHHLGLNMPQHGSLRTAHTPDTLFPVCVKNMTNILHILLQFTAQLSQWCLLNLVVFVLHICHILESWKQFLLWKTSSNHVHNQLHRHSGFEMFELGENCLHTECF